MKRSKIFLGITTAVLAVAGVSAAKHYNGTITRFYLTKVHAGTPQAYCKAVSLPCTISGTTPCVYTVLPDQFKAYTKGPEGVIGSTNKCTNQFLYNSQVQ